MCGIAGGISYSEKGEILLSRINSAVACLHARGPDQSGVYRHGNVALGQARLSVIDVSEAASQPFTDNSGRYTIVYNGEIYNFRELRKSLENKGVAFRSRSDTEVLLYGYIAEGAGFLEKVNGFFAFCIHDKAENTLFLARDRMGIKPLFIYRDGNAFLFASEMKALLKMGIPRQINPAALHAYLQLNYVPHPAAMLKDVTRAEPGSYIRVSAGKVESRSFYQIPYDADAITRRHDDYDTACRRVAELMDTAVQRRLLADVPLGAFLSGGIDSSIIVALASRHTNKLNTFSIGFTDEPFFDETRYAEEVARKYKTNHSVFRLATQDILDILPRFFQYTDEPFADSSALALYILGRETRRHVKVALSGDGADELYGGYIKHSAECRMREQGMAEKAVGLAGPLWTVLPKSRNSFAGNRIRQYHRFAAGIKLTASERYWRWASIAAESDVARLLLPLDKSEYEGLKEPYLHLIKEHGTPNDVLFADMHLVLRGDMLPKVDMMSMANSLEVRVPFLDHEHVNYVFSLPWYFKTDKHERKKILRDTFRPLLPESVFSRQKHGFEVPLLKWFRTELSAMINEYLLDRDFIGAQGIFNFAEIGRIVRKLNSGDPDDSVARVWGLLVFQQWWKRYFEPSNENKCPEY